MKQYNLGPNGGILTSLNLFATRFDQVGSIAWPCAADSDQKPRSQRGCGRLPRGQCCMSYPDPQARPRGQRGPVLFWRVTAKPCAADPGRDMCGYLRPAAWLQVIALCEKERDPPLQQIVVDTPGQIEIFTWSASGAIITEVTASCLTCGNAAPVQSAG